MPTGIFTYPKLRQQGSFIHNSHTRGNTVKAYLFYHCGYTDTHPLEKA